MERSQGYFHKSLILKEKVFSPPKVSPNNPPSRVINCVGDVFPDTYCFADGSMIVEALGCDSGSAKIKCKPSGSAKFKATVGGVSFKGKVRGSTIEGTAVSGDCESTFEGEEIRDCPCPTPLGAQEGTNPYLP